MRSIALLIHWLSCRTTIALPPLPRRSCTRPRWQCRGQSCCGPSHRMPGAHMSAFSRFSRRTNASYGLPRAVIPFFPYLRFAAETRESVNKDLCTPLSTPRRLPSRREAMSLSYQIVSNLHRNMTRLPDGAGVASSYL